jgi:hypothetical protein
MMEKQIYQILKNHKLSPKKRELVLIDLMDFINSKCTYDNLDDNDSEINAIGREIAEMSDEEFLSNSDRFAKILKIK